MDLETCWRIFWGLWFLVPCVIYCLALMDPTDRLWPEEYLILLLLPISGFFLWDFIPKWPETPTIGIYPAHVIVLPAICLPCFAAMVYLSRDDWSVRLSRKLARIMGIVYFGGMTLLHGFVLIFPHAPL